MAIPTTAAITMPSGTETNRMEATGRDGPLRLTVGSENQGKIIIAADVKDLCSCSDTFIQSLFLFNLCSYSIFVLCSDTFPQPQPSPSLCGSLHFTRSAHISRFTSDLPPKYFRLDFPDFSGIFWSETLPGYHMSLSWSEELWVIQARAR